MHIRSTRIRIADADALTRAREYFEGKVLPAYEGVDGFLGGTFVVDRAMTTAAANSMWRDEASAEASRRQAEGLVQGGRDAGLDIESVRRGFTLHTDRQQPAKAGAAVRIIQARVSDDRQDDLLAQVKRVNEDMRGSPGFRSMFVTRWDDGTASVLTTWDSAADLDADEAKRAGARPEALRSAGADLIGVVMGEALVAALREPEPAA